MGFFQRKRADGESENIVAVPGSDYERRLRKEEGTTELSHAEFKKVVGGKKALEDNFPRALHDEGRAPSEDSRVPRQPAQA